MSTPSPKPFSALLDVSALETRAQISQRFGEIAEALLYDHYLRIEHEETTIDFELLEIEFYLKKTGVHEDPFCHAHEDQQSPAQWYFHRAPRNTKLPTEGVRTLTDAGGYRGGTRKGLDLTFGTPITSSFFRAPRELAAVQCLGGILLRSMRSTHGTQELISGPSLLVDKILTITGSRNISELVRTKLNGCISALPPSDRPHLTRMYLAPCKRGPRTAIHRSPRIGLDLSHPAASPRPDNPRVVYLPRLYRFFVHPELLKANGRCHTLIGIYLEQAALADMVRLTALKQGTLEKYLADYTDGFEKKSLAAYVGTSGKGASANPKNFMRMMGVLARLGLLTVDGG